MAKSLKGQTKKAIHQAKVDQAGQLGTDINEFIFEDGMTVIEQVVGDFIERVHENIHNEKGMVTTGAINDITIEANGNTINVMANPHLIYQDRGVNGAKRKLYDTPHSYKDKRPPVEVFKQWIKDKNIRLEKNETYYGDPSPFKELTEEEQIEKAAWAMSTKVFQEGFKPRKIYSREIPQLVEDLQEQLADFAVQQIFQNIDINPRDGGGNRIIIRK